MREPRQRLVTLLPLQTLRALWAEADERDLPVGRLLDRILAPALAELADQRAAGSAGPEMAMARESDPEPPRRPERTQRDQRSRPDR